MEEKVPVKTVIRKTGNGFTPSITDALNGHFPNEKSISSKDLHQSYSGEELEEPFTREQFEAKWHEFIGRFDDRPNLKTTLSNTPEISEGYKLTLTIGSATINEEIKIIKPDMVSWLRKELRNTKIELETKVETHKIKKVIYTDSEKLQAMINKNPELNLLRQKFNLDFHE